MSGPGPEPAYLTGLNPDQREAVLHYGSPLLILAGAGSGKTRVITVKIAYLVDVLGVNPRDILAVTFTNKAAGEMRERAAAMSERAAEVMIRTFHSFGAWLLRRNSRAAGLSDDFTIYDDEDAQGLLKLIHPEQDRRFFSQNAAWISRAKDYGLRAGDELGEISGDPRFARVYGEYERRLAAVGNVDFGDLILKPIELLRGNEELRRRFHERFRVILVDEYQDSNIAQYELLKLLAGPGAYLCVVGDDDQSIYRFRGAEVRNILSFPEVFPGTKLLRLERNYRSTGRILAAASAVVANNKGRLGKTLWTENEEGPPPRLHVCDDPDAEARLCLRLLKQKPDMETAILYRTNAQSRAFEALFPRENQPYLIIGSVRFYEREEVKDALAFLKFIQNPRDELAFRRIVNKPPRGVGDGSRERVAAAVGEGGDLRQAVRAAMPGLRGKAAAGLDGFLKLIRGLEAALEQAPLPEFLHRLLEDSGLYDYHAGQDEAAGTQKKKNLEELVNAAGLYGTGRAALSEFLDAIELDRSRSEGQPDSAGRPAVLITMHNTKGLEFDRVIVTGLEEGLFPRGGEESEEDVEEERRLFYVAITRARRELHFTTCRYRLLQGRPNYLEPSRFLRELPEADRRGLGPAPADSKSDGWRPGLAVYHENYGRGLVCKCWSNGADRMLLVRFDTGQTMQFYPRYDRRLERIEQDGL